MPSTPALGDGGFEPYLQAVRRHPVLVIAVMLTTILAAGAWLLVRTPDYRATAQVLFTPAPYSDQTYIGLPVPRDTPDDPTRVLQTAAGVFDSSAAAALTAARLGDGWSASRVRAAVSVEPVGESNILAVQATDDDPRLAARVANTFAQSGLAARRRSLSRQAAILIAKLRPGRTALPPNLLALEAVRRGIDPSFGPLRPAGRSGQAVEASGAKVLGLALIAGAILGVAAALATVPR